MKGLPKECLQSGITDFYLKQQRIMQDILHEILIIKVIYNS